MASRQQKPGLSVLFVAAEIVPFAKEGGLADVAGALPRALAGLGLKMSAVMPLYGQIDKERFGLKPAKISSVQILMGSRKSRVSFWQASLPGGKVPVYFVENEAYFGRKGVYNDEKTGEGFTDNAERFILFQKAVIHLLKELPEQPDVVHCNDHHTGLLPYYVKRDPALKKIATVFSIHNLAYQGVELPELLPIADIPINKFTPMSPFEFWGKINMMKIGVHYADILSTVSPTYAKEIRTDLEISHGFEGILESRRKDLFGIINGIDTTVWNPATDKLISHNFTSAELKGKKANKQELQREFGLPVKRKRTPLFGMVGRLVDQKGLDILENALDEILALDLQMVVLGTGQKKYHEMFESAARRYPEKLAVKLAFDNSLAHLIEAGSDIFLMPSRYEPCGLNQLYSLAYGTVPIVRATGGLADTVQTFDSKKKTGTGFRFKEYKSEALLGAVKSAIEAYNNEEDWQQLMRNGMEKNFSWDTSAMEYIDIYKLATSKRRSTGE